MPRMNMVQALNSAMDVMLQRDPRVVILGEDVGFFGGVFRATEGLQRKYGEHRVLDTPIAEGGIIGAAIGMGANGLKPVAEIQFADYIYPGFDQIVSELARLRYRSAGDFSAQVTIRTPCGGGIRGGQTHSQSPEAIFTHVCGIKVVMPSNPYDAKGLLISSIEGDDPVVFFEPKRIYNGPFDGDPHRADRPRRGSAARGRRDGAHLRHHGACRGGGGPRGGRRCRDHRRAHHGATRCRHRVHLRLPDRAMRRGT
jgi:2-oxoisovalerate dehydrogenase E1 component beta subunit